ncbi:MAG: protein kinase domain-containing protein [Christensenellales bacterium]|jgi:serine/threonine protein kinase
MKDFSQIEKMCMNCHKQMGKSGDFCEFCGFDNGKPKSPHHLPPRTILAGKYMIGKVLGEGGFGITYMGYDLNLDCKVAIKEYYPAGFVSRETTVRNTVTFLTGMNEEYYVAGLEKFMHEAKALAKFSELPGIVRVRDYFQENGTAYIAMDYIEGRTLAEELNKRGGRLPAGEVLSKMEPLIRSLCVVHTNGIIHRDISPDNIMLNTRGELKLLDFGAARELASDKKSVAVMLKPGYAPEEQYRTKGEQGPWTDCYALCATIYKLITGITPPEALERLAKDSLVPPTMLGAEITPLVEQALMMGLAVKPEDRFRSLEALYNALYVDASPASAVNAAVMPNAVPMHSKTVPVQQGKPARQAKAPNTGKKPPVGLFAGLGVLVVGAIVALVLLLKPNPNQEVSANTPEPSQTVQESPTPTPSSTDGGFQPQFPNPAVTPVPDAPSSPGTTGLSIGNGEIRIPNFESFSGLIMIDGGERSDGSYSLKFDMVNTDVLVQYYGMLLLNNDLIVGDTGADNNLFYVQQKGGGYVVFDYNFQDEFVEIINPAGVHVEEYDPGVTYMYLCNNGLTYDQWFAMRNPHYNFDELNFRGNTGANIENSSCTAVQGDYLYFSEYTDTGYLYRMSLITGDYEPILEEPTYALHMNAQGDYLYFTIYFSGSGSGHRSIYRCPTTPGGSLELLREYATNPCVFGDYVYFTDYNDGSLNRMYLNGSNETRIADKCSQYIATGDGIYATDIDGTGIFLIDPDTLQYVKLSNEDVEDLILCGRYLYYTRVSDGYIYRIDKDDGGTGTLVQGVKATRLNWDGEDIYYTNTEDYYLYRIPMDGGDPIRMAQDGLVCVVHPWDEYVMVFYRTDAGDKLMAYNWSTQQGENFPF